MAKREATRSPAEDPAVTPGLSRTRSADLADESEAGLSAGVVAAALAVTLGLLVLFRRRLMPRRLRRGPVG